MNTLGSSSVKNMDDWPVSKYHIIKPATPRCLTALLCSARPARVGTVRKKKKIRHFASEWISAVLPPLLCDHCEEANERYTWQLKHSGWRERRWQFRRAKSSNCTNRNSSFKVYGFGNNKMLSSDLKCLSLLVYCSWGTRRKHRSFQTKKQNYINGSKKIP